MTRLNFCSSIGRYDRNHHRTMLEGEPFPATSPYVGDRALTHYAVIDLERFLRAVNQHLQTRSDIFPDGFSGITHQAVAYREKRNMPMDFNRVSEGVARLTREEMDEAINVKPPIFSPEREYRVVLHGNNDAYLAFETNFVDLRSDEIRRSILDIGEY